MSFREDVQVLNCIDSVYTSSGSAPCTCLNPLTAFTIDSHSGEDWRSSAKVGLLYTPEQWHVWVALPLATVRPFSRTLQLGGSFPCVYCATATPRVTELMMDRR